MSVADCLGLDGPGSVLMAAARAGWVRWCATEPDLAVVDDVGDLRAWTRRAATPDKDRVLGRLAALARDDQAAAITLVWLLLPGAIALADRLRDLSPDIDGLVAGQLWIEVARSRRLPPQGIAQAILNCTRREVLAELGVGRHGKLRDKVWSQTVLMDRFDQRAVLVAPAEPDAYEELIEIFDIALRDNAIEGLDLWLLHELATVATAEAAPLRRGRCGLTTPAVVEMAAGRRPEAPRTLRRRASKALDALAAYVEARSDEQSLARWRTRHPWRPVTVQDEFEALAVEAEHDTDQGRNSGLAIRADALPAAVWFGAPA